MFDKLLTIGCAFDWITPAVAFIQDFLNGPAGHFGVSANPYWGRKEIKRLLRHYDVKVWGLMYNYNAEILMFTVRRQQAVLAYYLLQSAGVPLLYVPDNVTNSLLQLTLDKIDLRQFESISGYPEYLHKGD